MSKPVFATAIACFICITDIVHAATFNCTPGDLFCLIASIGVANDTPGPNTINLAPGEYVLGTVNNTTVAGPNALPVVTGNVRIVGAGAPPRSSEGAHHGVPAPVPGRPRRRADA
jgi:hypothetical protein